MRNIRSFRLIAMLAFVFADTAAAQPAAIDLTLVKTNSGAVRGVAAGEVISFKGIPYAAAPTGALRWRAPQPVKFWTGVRAATGFSPSCMQTDEVLKLEDCLTLNVWRQAKPAAAPLPVMVWIHGGALVHGGTSLYPGDALAKQGIIVVSMNYRMGRLGFFAHPALLTESPDELHGNYGYMDQRAALQWVQRNIAAFGGDPKKVTMFGESAGGGSVMVHLTSPLSRGLFQRAMIQSPGMPGARAKVIPLTELDDAEKIAVDYARSVGIKDESPAALAGLRALPPDKLAEGSSSQDVFAALSAGSHVLGVAGAIRDGKLVVEEPEMAFAAGHQTMVPVVIGANDRDLGIGDATSKDHLLAIFGPDAATARKLYDPRDDQTLNELKQQVFADRSMVEPARHLADEIARAGEPAWLYRFSYVPESQRGSLKGAPHASEIPYTFNIPAALVGNNVTAADQVEGALVSAYWVAFGKTGDPNGDGRREWPRHDPAADRVIDFANTGVVVGPDPLKARLDLWQKLWSRDR